MLFEHTQNWRLYFILRIYVALHCEVLGGKFRVVYSGRQHLLCSIANQPFEISQPCSPTMCIPKCGSDDVHSFPSAVLK
jgi:hypothetical protein